MAQPSTSLRSLILAGVASLALAGAACAQEAPRVHFDIPAEGLGVALDQAAQQSHREIVFNADVTRGKQAGSLRGDYTAEQAVARLLAGTGLSVRTTSGGSLVVEAARPQADAEHPREAPTSTSVLAGAPGGTPTTLVGELIVTAEKRPERLQDVPLSVSAVTAQEISARDANNLEDLQYSIPNLSAFEYGPGQEFLQIGGIADAIGASTTAEYLDEAPITLIAAPLDVRLLDMERVEVLRGPQATLYGEGSMGGTIHYVTAEPNLTTYSAAMEAEAGTITGGAQSYKANGVLNLPLVQDTLGLRLVAGWERDGGWIDNTVTGQSNINGADLTTLRGTLLWRPTTKLALSLIVLHQNQDQANQNFAIDSKTTATVPTTNNDQYTFVNGVLKYDFGPVNVLDSVAYINNKVLQQDDLTPFYLPLLEADFGVPPGFISAVALPANSQAKIFTDELRFASDGQGRFNWLVGGYYRHAENDADEVVTTSPGTLPFTILSAQTADKSDAFAVFGQASYQLTRQLYAAVGLRYYQDRETSFSDSASFGFPSINSGAATFHTVNPEFNLRYEFSPTSMVYFDASKGFRSGGFNLTSSGGGVIPIPPTFAPDSIWTYRLGTKQQLLDRKLELDGDVYYSDWTNVQSTFFAPGSAITVIENGGKVTGWGADLSAIARPIDGLTLSGSYGWNDLAYRVDTADHDTGDPVDDAAHNSASASIDYRQPVFGQTVGFVRADYQHAGPAQITLRDFGGQIIHLPERDTVNLRAGLDFGPFSASVFATNVLNDRTPILPGPFGVITDNVEQRPRTVGVNLQAHF